jgi:hypothetical protein
MSDHVELLLLISGGVRGSSKSREVDQRCTADVIGDRLEGELQSMAEEAVESRSVVEDDLKT